MPPQALRTRTISLRFKTQHCVFCSFQQLFESSAMFSEATFSGQCLPCKIFSAHHTQNRMHQLRGCRIGALLLQIDPTITPARLSAARTPGSWQISRTENSETLFLYSLQEMQQGQHERAHGICPAGNSMPCVH